MHNMPGLDLGTFYFADGDVMAAVDNWEIEITGKGGHGSMPELSINPIVAGSSLVMALQTIVSRNVAPAHSAVVSVGAFESGDAGNMIAQKAILWSDVSEWTADTALSVLLKDLKAGFGEGLKHNFPLPFNALSATNLFDSMEKEKPSDK